MEEDRVGRDIHNVRTKRGRWVLLTLTYMALAPDLHTTQLTSETPKINSKIREILLSSQ